MQIENLITEHIETWTSAVKKKNATGRGSSKKIELYGIKKLRELILELAVRGKLVPQDPNEEPASVLLERISEKQSQLIADKKIRKQKSLPAITDEEKPFKVPNTWHYKRFGDVMFNRDGERKPVSSAERKGMQGKYDYYGASGVIDQVNDFLFDKSLLLIGEDGANLISRSTPIAFLAHGKYWVNNHAHVLDGITINFLEFIALHINAISLEDYITGTAQPKMNQAKMNSIVLAIPPEAEQHRIVAKVDELMLLCDQLEQQTESSIDAHKTLVEVLLNTLTDAKDATELQTNWARVSEFFDTLFTTENSIDQLKQTILQLAVMGKLVSQDPSDEPASKLLERIAEEKAQLIADKKIKKQKPLPEITDEEKPFELPNGWEWSKLGEVSLIKGGFAYKSSLFTETGEHQVIRMGNIRPDFFRLEQNVACINSELAESTPDYEILNGDILLTMTGTKGKRDYLYSLLVNESHLNRRKLYLNQRLCISRGVFVEQSFINIVLKENTLLDLIYKKSTGTANQANIGMEAIMNWVIPIPPVEEQQRIVEKLQIIMKICDQLKSQLNQAQQTQLDLTDALVAQVV